MPTTLTLTVGSASIFPLSVSANGRTLQTASGDPFFMIGDSPQAMVVNIAPTDNVTSTDAGVFLSTRWAQGFNTIWTNVISTTYTGGRTDSSTYDGIVPFNSTIAGGYYNITDPKATYWARVDQMVQLATDYGFYVFLDPIETGGYNDTLNASSTSACTTYGQFLGNRYASYSNVAWLHGNDYLNWPTLDTKVIAVADGIRTNMPDAIQTVQLDYQTSGSLDDSNFSGHIDINASYTYDAAYVQLLSDYNRASFLPNFLVEASYEHEQNPGAVLGDPHEIRRQGWWSLTNGATGHWYGEHSCWDFASGWQNQLGSPNSPGASHLIHLADFAASVAWATLVPDQSHTLLTANYGTFGTANFNYATAAKNSGGTLAVVFVPYSTNVTCNLSTMAGPVTGRWYDPTNGTYTSAGTGMTGSHTFTHPGNNNYGDPDWVLRLDA